MYTNSRKKKINLSMNENHCCKRTYRKIDLAEYPETEALSLKAMIVKETNLSNVFVTAGIDEAIYFFLKLVEKENGTLLLETPNYYGVFDALSKINIPITKVNILEEENLIDIIMRKTNINFAYICNPRNPIGTTYTELLKLFDICKRKGIIVFLDEAYCEFAYGMHSPIESKLSEYDNIVLAKTFSKAYGLAGIRVGYCLSNNSLFCNYMLEMQCSQPFHISTFSQKIAMNAIRDVERLNRGLKLVKRNRDKIMSFFKEKGVSFFPSETNFISFFTGENTHYLLEYFEKNGILITSLEPFGLPKYCRVSIGNTKETAKFIFIYNEYLEG